MDTIECGTGACSMRVDDDGICTTVYSGLLLPENFPRLAARAMQAGAERQARGLLSRVDKAAVCCDPASMMAAYRDLPAQVRALPAAFVISPGQVELCDALMRGAGAAGLLRRAFFSEAEARAWLGPRISQRSPPTRTGGANAADGRPGAAGGSRSGAWTRSSAAQPNL